MRDLAVPPVAPTRRPYPVVVARLPVGVPFLSHGDWMSCVQRAMHGQRGQGRGCLPCGSLPFRAVRARGDEPETVSLVDLSGFELFNAERLARAVHAGVRRGPPERVQPDAFPEPSGWERALLRGSGAWLREADRITREGAEKREKACAPLRWRARRLEEHRSTVRPPWFEGDRFLASPGT